MVASIQKAGLLEGEGSSIDVDLNQPGSVRAIVRKSGEATRVERTRDSAWRFMPTMRDERIGFTHRRVR
jgi:hypothetical protein